MADTNDNRPHAVSTAEWQELIAIPEVQESWGLDAGNTPEEFASMVYAAKFNFVSGTMPGYVGNLYILHGNALTGDAPFVFRRGEDGKLVLTEAESPCSAAMRLRISGSQADQAVPPRAAPKFDVRPESGYPELVVRKGSLMVSSHLHNACTEIRNASSHVANWMMRQPAVGEESLTDWLLFEISERLPWVRYKKFTRHEESRDSGADWEWWFVSDIAAIGLRIQAKKVVDGVDHYRGLAHTNTTGLQIELLLEAAQKKNLLPFYALYHQSRGNVAPMCRGNLPVSQSEGVSVAHARALYDKFVKAGRINVQAADLLGLSNPLACFFCCPLTERGDDAVVGIYNQISEYFGLSVENNESSNIPRPGWHERAPAHVSALLEGDHGSGPEWWEREFADDTRLTRALLVFDLRQD